MTSKKYNPWERALKDLKYCVMRKMKKEVIILIDANAGTDSSKEEMTEMIQECELVDTHLFLHPLRKRKDRL